MYTEQWPSSTVMTTERPGSRGASQMVDKRAQRDDGISLLSHEFQLPFERRDADRHAVGRDRAEAVIDQDRVPAPP